MIIGVCTPKTIHEAVDLAENCKFGAEGEVSFSDNRFTSLDFSLEFKGSLLDLPQCRGRSREV